MRSMLLGPVRHNRPRREHTAAAVQSASCALCDRASPFERATRPNVLSVAGLDVDARHTGFIRARHVLLVFVLCLAFKEDV